MFQVVSAVSTVEKVMSNKYNLKIHIRDIHETPTEQQKWICEYCNQRERKKLKQYSEFMLQSVVVQTVQGRLTTDESYFNS